MDASNMFSGGNRSKVLSRRISIFVLVVVFTMTLSGISSVLQVKTTMISHMNMTDTAIHKVLNEVYVPSAIEAYVVDFGVELGLDSIHNPSGCALWRESNETVSEVHQSARANYKKYVQELAVYNTLVDSFSSLVEQNITDLRVAMRQNPVQATAVCQAVDLHLDTIFSDLSWVSSRTGFCEPLLPPLRHPAFCEAASRANLFDLTYMVHDFGAICRRLKPHSRTILIDMGASLSFHGNLKAPPIYLIELYKKFGIVFDHIYAYEMTPQDTSTVFGKLLPEDLQASYHWINIGVESTPGSRMNPFTMLKKHYLPDDLIIVKLDIDTSSIEVPLAKQLLNDTHLHSLVDHFYFEHHVHLKELSPYWGRAVQGTVHESLQLFHQLREKGIAAHYWV
jgi:hypothetical protein